MSRTERLLSILQALREMQRPATAALLARRFDVSERTIYRDIATLVWRGAVIEGATGVGYILRDDFFLPPLAFDREEAAAIMLGLRFVARRGDEGLIAAAASVRAKLTAVAPEQFSQLSALSAPLVVGPRTDAGNPVLAAVREALMSERKLTIKYSDEGGHLSERTIWPVALGWFDDAEMLAAWCEKRLAFRHFRIDRISVCRLVDERPPRSRRRLLADYKALEPGIAL